MTNSLIDYTNHTSWLLPWKIFPSLFSLVTAKQEKLLQTFHCQFRTAANCFFPASSMSVWDVRSLISSNLQLLLQCFSVSCDPFLLLLRLHVLCDLSAAILFKLAHSCLNAFNLIQWYIANSQESAGQIAPSITTLWLTPRLLPYPGFPRTCKTLKTWKMKNKFPDLEKSWKKEKQENALKKSRKVFEKCIQKYNQVFFFKR